MLKSVLFFLICYLLIDCNFKNKRKKRERELLVMYVLEKKERKKERKSFFIKSGLCVGRTK